MNSKVKTTLIILTRNEIQALRSLINKIPFKSLDEYFAVDYNSKDGTLAFLKEHKVPVINQKVPGRGEAMRIAAKRARGDILVFFSPDGNENPSDIKILIQQIQKGSDLAIASRFMRGGRNEEDENLLKLRAWANIVFTYLANIIWKGTLTDALNGFRAIRKSAFYKLRLDAQGYAIEYQMSIRVLKLGLKISEIPTIEAERIGGKSGSSSIPTGLKHMYNLGREIIIGKNFNRL